MLKNPNYRLVMHTPIGTLAVVLHKGVVSGLDFADAAEPSIDRSDSAVAEVERQIQAYFYTGHFRFSLPLELSGTDFQRRVWTFLQRIEPGTVRTYGGVARELKTSPRAVGGACRSNPVPLIVPCHRVVSVAGIGGYAGATSGRRLDVKRWLLEHEGVHL